MEKKAEENHNFIEKLKGEILSDPLKFLEVKNLSAETSNINEQLRTITLNISNMEGRSNADYRFLITLVSGFLTAIIGGGVTLTIFLLRRRRDVEGAVHSGQPTGPPP